MMGRKCAGVRGIGALVFGGYVPTCAMSPNISREDIRRRMSQRQNVCRNTAMEGMV